MKTWISALALTLAFAVPDVALAQTHEPVENVGRRHANLEAAQQLCTQAYSKLVASQKANEFDEGGHAQHAKELLDQVNQELRALPAQTIEDDRSNWAAESRRPSSSMNP